LQAVYWAFEAVVVEPSGFLPLKGSAVLQKAFASEAVSALALLGCEKLKKANLGPKLKTLKQLAHHFCFCKRAFG